eukprot:m.27313 g.27313  ORF g.27313 m.27313 type:complete len:78 (-) comp7884_c0_seq2:221-454(-)
MVNANIITLIREIYFHPKEHKTPTKAEQAIHAHRLLKALKMRNSRLGLDVNVRSQTPKRSTKTISAAPAQKRTRRNR